MNLKSSMLRACIVLALACGSPKYDQQQTQVPITPVGSVVGRITDLGTGAPIEGVTVTAVGPTPRSATSDASGVYIINEMVVGSDFSVIFEKAGYLRSIGSTTVPSTAGSAPLTGGFRTLNVNMAKPDGEVRGTLLLPNGTPAVGATVYVDQRGNGFDSVVTTVTDMTGTFKLTGLATAPSGLYFTVYAQWFDQNLDGITDFGAVSQGIYLWPGTPGRMILTYSDLGQVILASNIADAELGASEEISLTFAIPVIPGGLTGAGSSQFTLYNTTRNNSQVAVVATWASATQVTLKPQGELNEGDRYRLDLNGLLPVGGGSLFYNSLSFQVRGANVVGPSAPVTNLVVTNNASTSVFNYNTSNFIVSFDPVPDVLEYWIYAKDTSLNLAFSRVTTVTISPSAALGRVSRSFTLPNSFNNSQPLTNNTQLTVAVVPVDGYGNAGALSAAPTATIRDNVAPTTSSTQAIGAVDAINDTTTESTLTLRLTYSEPMDPTSTPVLTSMAGTFAQSFTWNANTNSGVLTLKVPMKTDLSGSFVIRGGKDAAGNAVSGPEFTGVLGGRKELLVNGGFEDAAGACSLAGWTATSSGGMPMVVAVAGAGVPSVGACAALIGAPLGSAPALGVAKLSQDIVLPDISTNPSWRFEIRHSERPEYFSPTGTPATVTQRCRMTDTSDALVQNIFSFTSVTQPTYTGPILTAFVPLTPGQTVRMLCQVDNSVAAAPAVNAALYLDDLSLAVVKNTTFNN